MPGYHPVGVLLLSYVGQNATAAFNSLAIPLSGKQPAQQRELHIDCCDEITDQRKKQQGSQACFVYGGYKPAILLPNPLARYSGTKVLLHLSHELYARNDFKSETK